MQEAIRKLDISVISDVHLATMASKAKHLLKYLKSIQPKILVLNGDIIDSWRFSRNYFPKAHLKVIRQFVKMIEKGVRVVYITGNHDDVFRKFNNTQLGNFSIVNQFELTVGNQRTWIFHGDVFDHIIHHSPWLAKSGAAAYGLLTGFNKGLNFILRIFGGKDMILYKSMKDRISKEKKVLSNFELAIANAALSKEIDLVICGHTHIPVDKTITTEKGTVSFNFKPFSPVIFPPVIRSAIRNAEATVKAHYTVYLPAYSNQQIQDVLSQIPDTEWQVFSKHSKHNYTVENIHFQPVSLDGFTESFLSCTGLICTAGFEGPAEAIFLGKKLCVIPMKGQYEQFCNAAYLKSMGIKVLDHFTGSAPELTDWIQNSTVLQISFPDMTDEILEEILLKHGDF